MSSPPPSGLLLYTAILKSFKSVRRLSLPCCCKRSTRMPGRTWNTPEKCWMQRRSLKRPQQMSSHSSASERRMSCAKRSASSSRISSGRAACISETFACCESAPSCRHEVCFACKSKCPTAWNKASKNLESSILVVGNWMTGREPLQ